MNQAKILKYTKYRTENKRTDPITPAHKQHSQENTHKVSLWIHFSVSVCCLGVFLCVFAVVFYLLVVVPSDYCGQCAFRSAFLPWVSDSVNMLMLYKYFALFCSCFHIKLWTMSLNSQDCYLLFLHISLIRCFRIFVLESWQVKGHLTSDPIDSDMRLDNFKAGPRAWKWPPWLFWEWPLNKNENHHVGRRL